MLGLLVAFITPANAEMVTTDQILHESEVSELKLELDQALQRDDIRAELELLGVSPEAAQARVARLNDGEVMKLHQKVDSLPAGSGVVGLLLIILILVIVL